MDYYGDKGANNITNIYDLKGGDYNLIEGKVDIFSPGSASPKRFEYLQVNRKKIMYSQSALTGGLEKIIANSGITKGSDVKIYYKGEAILRIEMKK